MKIILLMPGVALFIAARVVLAAEPAPAAGAAPFLEAVRRFADLALEHGRDRYGKPTPLFVDGINVDTLEPARWKWADGREWVISNLSSHQGLLRTLDGLSTLTGEPRYKNAAKAALRYAFDHLRYGTENNSGLLAWGGHLTYNATDDVITGHPNGAGRIHELKSFFPHYALMWDVDPVATRQQIENTWNGHILDWSNLDFNRHANPSKPGPLWESSYRDGEVFFWGRGLTFHNAGADFYYAAAALAQLSGDPRPLTWAKRLAQRYVETRDPKTGLEGFQFSQSAQAWCDDEGKIRGDRAQYQFGDDFKGHRVFEGTLFSYANVKPEAARLMIGDLLGDPGRQFTQWAVEELVAWGRSSYRASDNTFVPMLTDGTSMEGYVCKKDGYFGPKGRVVRAGHAGAQHFWIYAQAFRMSGEPLLWEMARAIARGTGWGDIGAMAKGEPSLALPQNLSDPDALVGMLELHRATGRAAFLAAAQRIGRTILTARVHEGWFVPGARHLYCRLANDESQALLHLAAALLGRTAEIPAYAGGEPFFHAEYGGQRGRVYDTQVFYEKYRR